jgi:hypothetical protein
MNTSCTGQPEGRNTACPSNTLQRGEIERRLKAAVQSGSPEQVDAFDASMLVGCVDWYRYDAGPEAERQH